MSLPILGIWNDMSCCLNGESVSSIAALRLLAVVRLRGDGTAGLGFDGERLDGNRGGFDLGVRSARVSNASLRGLVGCAGVLVVSSIPRKKPELSSSRSSCDDDAAERGIWKDTSDEVGTAETSEMSGRWRPRLMSIMITDSMSAGVQVKVYSPDTPCVT